MGRVGRMTLLSEMSTLNYIMSSVVYIVAGVSPRHGSGRSFGVGTRIRQQIRHRLDGHAGFGDNPRTYIGPVSSTRSRTARGVTRSASREEDHAPPRSVA